MSDSNLVSGGNTGAAQQPASNVTGDVNTSASLAQSEAKSSARVATYAQVLVAGTDGSAPSLPQSEDKSSGLGKVSKQVKPSKPPVSERLRSFSAMAAVGASSSAQSVPSTIIRPSPLDGAVGHSIPIPPTPLEHKVRQTGHTFVNNVRHDSDPRHLAQANATQNKRAKSMKDHAHRHTKGVKKTAAIAQSLHRTIEEAQGANDAKLQQLQEAFRDQMEAVQELATDKASFELLTTPDKRPDTFNEHRDTAAVELPALGPAFEKSVLNIVTTFGLNRYDAALASILFESEAQYKCKDVAVEGLSKRVKTIGERFGFRVHLVGRDCECANGKCAHLKGKCYIGTHPSSMEPVKIADIAAQTQMRVIFVANCIPKVLPKDGFERCSHEQGCVVHNGYHSLLIGLVRPCRFFTPFGYLNFEGEDVRVSIWHLRSVDFTDDEHFIGLPDQQQARLNARAMMMTNDAASRKTLHQACLGRLYSHPEELTPPEVINRGIEQAMRYSQPAPKMLNVLHACYLFAPFAAFIPLWAGQIMAVLLCTLDTIDSAQRGHTNLNDVLWLSLAAGFTFQKDITCLLVLFCYLAYPYMWRNFRRFHVGRKRLNWLAFFPALLTFVLSGQLHLSAAVIYSTWFFFRKMRTAQRPINKPILGDDPFDCSVREHPAVCPGRLPEDDDIPLREGCRITKRPYGTDCRVAVGVRQVGPVVKDVVPPFTYANCACAMELALKKRQMVPARRPFQQLVRDESDELLIAAGSALSELDPVDWIRQMNASPARKEQMLRVHNNQLPEEGVHEPMTIQVKKEKTCASKFKKRRPRCVTPSKPRDQLNCGPTFHQFGVALKNTNDLEVTYTSGMNAQALGRAVEQVELDHPNDWVALLCDNDCMDGRTDTMIKTYWGVVTNDMFPWESAKLAVDTELGHLRYDCRHSSGLEAHVEGSMQSGRTITSCWNSATHRKVIKTWRKKLPQDCWVRCFYTGDDGLHFIPPRYASLARRLLEETWEEFGYVLKCEYATKWSEVTYNSGCFIPAVGGWVWTPLPGRTLAKAFYSCEDNNLTNEEYVRAVALSIRASSNHILFLNALSDRLIYLTEGAPDRILKNWVEIETTEQWANGETYAFLCERYKLNPHMLDVAYYEMRHASLNSQFTSPCLYKMIEKDWDDGLRDEPAAEVYRGCLQVIPPVVEEIVKHYGPLRMLSTFAIPFYETWRSASMVGTDWRTQCKLMAEFVWRFLCHLVLALTPFPLACALHLLFNWGRGSTKLVRVVTFLFLFAGPQVFFVLLALPAWWLSEDGELSTAPPAATVVIKQARPRRRRPPKRPAAKKNNKGNRRRRNQRPPQQRATSIPAAMYSPPSSRMNIQHNDRTRISRATGCEVLNSVMLTQNYQATVYNINPMDTETFPRLSSVASAFEKYRIVSMRVRWHPGCPTSSAGSIAFYIDFNVSDAPAASIQEVMANEVAAVGPVWQILSAKPAVWPRNDTWYFTRSSPASTDGSRQWQFPGQLVCITNNSGSGLNGTLGGWLSFEYVIEFLRVRPPPQIASTAISLSSNAPLNNAAQIVQWFDTNKSGVFDYLFNPNKQPASAVQYTDIIVDAASWLLGYEGTVTATGGLNDWDEDEEEKKIPHVPVVRPKMLVWKNPRFQGKDQPDLPEPDIVKPTAANDVTLRLNFSDFVTGATTNAATWLLNGAGAQEFAVNTEVVTTDEGSFQWTIQLGATDTRHFSGSQMASYNNLTPV